MAIDTARRNDAQEMLLSAAGTRIEDEREVETIQAIILQVVTAGMDVCLDFGLTRRSVLQRFYHAGARCYINSVQTSRARFGQYITTQRYEDKLEVLATACELGYVTRTGVILGLGESAAERKLLAAELQALPVDEISLCLFQPIDGSLMSEHPMMTSEEAMGALQTMREQLAKPLYLLGGREKVLAPADIPAALALVDGTTVGNYLFTSGETAQAVRNRL